VSLLNSAASSDPTKKTRRHLGLGHVATQRWTTDLREPLAYRIYSPSPVGRFGVVAVCRPSSNLGRRYLPYTQQLSLILLPANKTSRKNLFVLENKDTQRFQIYPPNLRTTKFPSSSLKNGLCLELVVILPRLTPFWSECITKGLSQRKYHNNVLL